MKTKQTKTKKVKETPSIIGGSSLREIPVITAKIKILGKIYSSQGQTVKDAIQGLKVIGIPKTMSVLTVNKPDKSRSRVLMPKQTFRLFSPSPLMRQIAIKQISMLF